MMLRYRRHAHAAQGIKPGRKAIMITAADDEDIAREAMERGAVDYVTKPPDLTCLDTQVTFQSMY